MSLKTLAYLPIFALASGAMAQTLTNQGLVGYAELPADSVDFLGDTVSEQLQAVKRDHRLSLPR